MGNAAPYQPDKLASSVVGTPGVNTSAGMAFKMAADAAAQLHRQNAAYQSQNANMAVNGILSVGQGLVGVFNRMRANSGQNSQKTALKTAAMNKQKAIFERTANDLRRQYEKTYTGPDGQEASSLERPSDAYESFKTRLSEERAKATNAFNTDSMFRDDPVFQAKWDADLEGMYTDQDKLMGDWSQGRQEDQAMEFAKNQVATTKEEIANLDPGKPMADRVNEYYHHSKRLDLNLIDSESFLGADKMGKMRTEAHDTLGVALFENLLSTEKDTPEESLKYMQDAHELLRQSQKHQIFLDSDSKLRLDQHFDRVEQYYQNAMASRFTVDDMASDFQTSVRKQSINQNWNNGPLQQQAINYATGETRKYEEKYKQVMADPRLTDKIKNAYGASLRTRIGHLDSLTQAAKANLNHIDTEHRRDVREAKAQANENARNARRIAAEQNSAANKLARQQMKEMARGAETEVNKQIEEVWALSQNPEKNAAALSAASKRLYDTASKHENEGNLTPAKASAARMSALGLTDSANRYETQTNFFKFWDTKGELKRKDWTETTDKREAAVKEIRGHAQALKDLKTENEVNNFAGLTSSQQEYFTSKLSELNAKAKAEKWPTAILNQRKEALRTRARTVIK